MVMNDETQDNLHVTKVAVFKLPELSQEKQLEKAYDRGFVLGYSTATIVWLIVGAFMWWMVHVDMHLTWCQR
jgi:hypothetical protein